VEGRNVTTTLFTWGYYGWGNATAQLVVAVDVVEKARGFEPPLFVDTRIRRSVRAKGFTGNAFEKRLGPERHRWMKSLGNRHILTRTGPFIQIAEPAAAADLLALAVSAGERRRRVLFFCSCEWPREDGKTACHRDIIADLVLSEARKRGCDVEVVEWPGGDPAEIELEVTPAVLKSVKQGRATVPLGRIESPASLAAFAGLPWGSGVTLRCGASALWIASGPARCQPDGWVLPVFTETAVNLRHQRGLEPRSCGVGS
jgi:hypothetical protein